MFLIIIINKEIKILKPCKMLNCEAFQPIIIHLCKTGIQCQRSRKETISQLCESANHFNISDHNHFKEYPPDIHWIFADPVKPIVLQIFNPIKRIYLADQWIMDHRFWPLANLMLEPIKYPTLMYKKKSKQFRSSSTSNFETSGTVFKSPRKSKKVQVAKSRKPKPEVLKLYRNRSLDPFLSQNQL